MSKKYNYPVCEKVETFEEYFGVCIQDDYRWLENANDPKVLDWVAKENAYTDAYFDSAKVKAKMEELKMKAPNASYTSMNKCVDGYYVSKRENGNTTVLHTDFNLENEELVIAKNTIENFKVYGVTPCPLNPEYLAVYGGFDKDNKPSHVILNAKTKEVIKVLKSVWAGVWSKTEEVFYYGDSIPSANTKDGVTTITALSLPSLEEKVVFEDHNNATLPVLHLSSDKKTLMVEMWDNFVQYRYVGVDVETNTATIINEKAAQITYIDSVNNTHYFISKETSERGEIIAVNGSDFNGASVLRESDAHVLEKAFFLQDELYVITMFNASSKLLHVKDGNSEEVKLPSDICTLEFMTSEEDHVLLSYESFTDASTILSFDGKEMKTVYTSSKKAYSGINVEQRWAPSKVDKTMIPYFIVYKEGTKLDGNNPLLAYAYGGYNSSMKPWYQDMVSGVIVPEWVNKGGIYVIITLRGGSEFGSKWHEEGMLNKKKNCYYDFIGVCETMIEEGWTKASKIGIDGCSNGGLLMSTLITMRPDLFGCVINSVPHTDMLHFAEDDNGPRYITEYGNPKESKEMLEYMLSYSPYHNVRNVDYPPMYCQTGECDNNVPPYHGKKFAAKMQAMNTSDNPLLFRVLKEGAHDRGSGEVYWQTISEMQLFLEEHLGM